MSDERDIGIVNGWRYVVFEREGDGMFCVVRKSLGLYDHGRRQAFVDSRPSEKEAVEAGRKHMERVSKVAARYWGGPIPVMYTNK
jgi:hypothetical protein